MHERELRTALHAHLKDNHLHDDDTLIVNEFSIDGLDRVDVATINGSLTGYELKSAHDNLLRLERQAPSYSRVMDYLFLVATNAHLSRARVMIPSWWGVITVTTAGGSIFLRQSRQARPNPRIDAPALARLLWRDEALGILTARELDKGLRTKPRAELCDRLATQLPLQELRYEVREQIKGRRCWRESPEPPRSGGTLPREDMIPHFLARRLRMPQR